jgi:hypothetical protein
MQRPRDLADRSRDLRDLSKLTDDGPLHETFTLPPGRHRSRTSGEIPSTSSASMQKRFKVGSPLLVLAPFGDWSVFESATCLARSFVAFPTDRPCNLTRSAERYVQPGLLVAVRVQRTCCRPLAETQTLRG